MARATTSTSKENGNGQAKDLDAEIAALREDIASITSTIGNMAKNRTNEAKAEVERAGRKVMGKGEEAVEVAQENFENFESELKSMIREKPVQSVLIAAGVGYILSKVFRV